MSSNNQGITLAEAIDLTFRFQASRPAAYPICETFDLDAINDLISVSGCQSFRIYFGMKDDGSVVTVLVAVDADGNDILPSSDGAASKEVSDSDGDPIILEDGFRCPQYCPASSPLIAS